MRLLALTLAAAAAVAFAALQNPSAVAQSSDTQAGGKSQSTQGNAAGQERGSKGSATRQSGSRGQSAGRSEGSQQSAQGKSERSQTTVGIGSGSARATIHSRSRIQTRLSVRERGVNNVTIKGKRSRHITALHDQPSAMVIKKKKKFVRYGARTRFVASAPEERALIIKKKRHPSIAIRGESSRTTFRSHVGGSNINARASVRTRETTSGSATTMKRQSTGSSTTMNRGQRPAPSATTGSGGSQSRGQNQSGTKNQSGNKPQSGNTGGSQQNSP